MNDELLAALRAAPQSSGIFTDFDGTLSHIAEVPSDARPIEGARDLLRRLAERYAVVSVVSGRSAAELVEWLGTGIEIWGVHGAETVVDGEVVLAPRAERHLKLMREVLRASRERVARIPMRGLLVEDKTVMVTFHYRAADDVDEARVLLDEIVDDLVREYGLERAEGKLAVELRPPERFTKEAVVESRAREAQLRAVLFAGDDVVDLPAFEALDTLARDGVTTARVAVASDEAPPELLARADITVNGPEGVVGLFEKLLS